MMIVSSVALAVTLACLVMIQRNRLTLADTERALAEAWRMLDRPADARRCDERAAKFERRAWPFKPKAR